MGKQTCHIHVQSKHSFIHILQEWRGIIITETIVGLSPRPHGDTWHWQVKASRLNWQQENFLMIQEDSLNRQWIHSFFQTNATLFVFDFERIDFMAFWYEK